MTTEVSFADAVDFDKSGKLYLGGNLKHRKVTLIMSLPSSSFTKADIADVIIAKFDSCGDQFLHYRGQEFGFIAADHMLNSVS